MARQSGDQAGQTWGQTGETSQFDMCFSRELTVCLDGLIDFAQNAREMSCRGKIESRGTDIRSGNGGQTVLRHGERMTRVVQVEQAAHSIDEATRRGLQAVVVTVNAVFRLRSGRVPAAEVTSGVNFWVEILNRIGFAYVVSRNPEVFDHARCKE